MKKVIIIDDTKNIRILLRKCLELEGYKVWEASDGHQALDLFDNEKFDLAFLDIKMPSMSGTELLRKIRGKGIATPFIIITAYATIKNAVECTQMGAIAYLQKPFTAEKVRTTLNEVGFSYHINDDYSIKHIENAIYQGLYGNAVEMLKVAISLEPTNPNIYLLFAKAYNGLGDIENENKFKRLHDSLV